jgi:HD-like signal output (HDOD) protein
VISVEPGSAPIPDQALKNLDRLPPFSPILNRLLATLAEEDVSFAFLAELIEKDTVLAGNVLRVVNSALYGLQGSVNSVRHAVAILGTNKLRNVALSMSISRMWTQARTPPGWSTARFNMHSAATAVLTDLLSQRVDVPYPEGGFVAGLLHDIGKLLIAVSLPGESCEPEVFGIGHPELSGAVLERWNLPAPIREAALFHHAPGEELHLSWLVNAADRLANGLGHSLIPQPPEPEPGRDCLEALGIGETLPDLLEQFEVEFEILRQYF